MKTTHILWLGGLVFILAACAAQPVMTTLPTEPTPATAAEPGSTIFKTEVGDLVYLSARYEDKANGVTPTPGNKLLLVALERSDRNGIDLQAFQDARMEIQIVGDDGSTTISTMAGLVGPEYTEFVIGFQAPESAKSFQLVWGDNPPVEVNPEK